MYVFRLRHRCSRQSLRRSQVFALPESSFSDCFEKCNDCAMQIVRRPPQGGRLFVTCRFAFQPVAPKLEGAQNTVHIPQVRRGAARAITDLFNLGGPIESKSIMKVIASLLATTVLCSQGAEPTSAIKLPLSHVESIDATNMTFVVKRDATNLTVRYTTKTKFFISRMPAISKDVEPADHVSGILRATTNGVAEAVRIHIVKLAPK